MKKNKLVSLLFSAVALLAFVPIGHALMLNEIRTDQPSNPDDEEYIEIRGVVIAR